MRLRVKNSDNSLRASSADVLVISAHKGLLKERMKIAAKLRSAGIRAKISYKVLLLTLNNLKRFNALTFFKTDPKFLDQVQQCETDNIPLGVVIGQEELNSGVVKLKDIKSRSEKVSKICQDYDMYKHHYSGRRN